MVLTRRELPGAAGDRGGLPIGRVSRTSPGVFVIYDGREYGPVLLTKAAVTATLAVGDQVLISQSDVDTDRLIVIDGMA